MTSTAPVRFSVRASLHLDRSLDGGDIPVARPETGVSNSSGAIRGEAGGGVMEGRLLRDGLGLLKGDDGSEEQEGGGEGVILPKFASSCGDGGDEGRC